MCMLNTLRAILPIGPEQWEQVVHRHEEKWPAQLRDRDSINRKYSTLHRKSIPTGDPNISPAVKLAKEIKHFIGVKANFGDGEDEFDLEEGYKTNSEDNASTSTPPPPLLRHQPSQTQDTTQLTEMSNPSPTPQLAQYTQLSEYTQLTGATQASTTQEPQQSMVTPRQKQRSNKRSYSSRTSSSNGSNTDFASMFQMSLQQQQAIAQQSFEQSMKQHERTMTDIKDILASLAGAFARPRQKKNKRKKYEESDSDSDDSE